MRRIADAKSIPLAQKESLSTLNLKLRQGKVYNQLVARQVDAWADLRNYADHGHFNEFTEHDVNKMLGEVRAFLAQYLI
jgi:hypothetical protein